MQPSYLVFQTELGWCGILGNEGRIRRLVLPRLTRDDAVFAIKEGMPAEIIETKHELRGEADRLSAYFAGNPVSFVCDIEAPNAGVFDRHVWTVVREIPCGEVRTYAWVARLLGIPGGARAVGQSLGRNPVPIIVPCHRVIRSDGRLGGFSAGVEWKSRLLALEGAVPTNESGEV